MSIGSIETELKNALVTSAEDCIEDDSKFDTFDNTTKNISWSNWDNLLSYIKLHLGSTVNNVEFTDDEIVEIIQEHVLPEFSKYIPLQRYYLMSEYENVIARSPILVYQFKNFKYKILNVNKLIRKPSVLDMTQYYNLQQTSGDLTDMLIAQNSFSMTKDFISQDTWRFLAPDKLQFIRGSNNYGSVLDFIVDLNCVHEDPSTVDPDQYHLLRDLSLSMVFISIGSIRTKFSTFNTPQSQVDVKGPELLDEGKQLREKTLQELEDLPPDNYIYFLN